MIYFVMTLLMLSVENSQCFSTRFSQNALQTCKSLNNVTGYRLGISYTCTALRYKSAFIAAG